MCDKTSQACTVGPWRRRGRRLAYANPWLEVFHDDVDRPDGSPGIYGVVHFRTQAVGVVAVGDDGRLLLVGQHRYTLGAWHRRWPVPACAPYPLAVAVDRSVVQAFEQPAPSVA